jgi:hypothetical protein
MWVSYLFQIIWGELYENYHRLFFQITNYQRF